MPNWHIKFTANELCRRWRHNCRKSSDKTFEQRNLRRVIQFALLEANAPFIFARGEYQFIQGFNDAAKRRVMLSYDLTMLSNSRFQLRYLGGEFLLRRERLSQPDEGAKDRYIDLDGLFAV